jgi:hypothetical protein
MILKWNEMQDIMGIGQTIWVLKFELEYFDGLDYLDPNKFFDVYMPKFRQHYARLVRQGKIKPLNEKE